MEKQNRTAKVKSTTEKISSEGIISLYMDYVLENDREPRSIYKFSKDIDITEDEFYQHFGSFEGLKKDVWRRFFSNSMELIKRSPEFESFTNREKLLTFYYTFFENLTANRSYVLFILSREPQVNKNLDQLKGLRRQVIGFAKELIRERNEEKTAKFLKQSETVFSEATWIQLLFLLKFWMDDNSARFESTDVAIEKSVNTVFDLFDNTPLERVVDLGKFLWKEKMG